jgi:hypothetical protein
MVFILTEWLRRFGNHQYYINSRVYRTAKVALIRM